MRNERLQVLVEYIFVYLMIDVFCLCFSLFIYSKITIDMGTEREVRALRWFVIAYDAFLVFDAIWAMGEYDDWLGTDAAIGIIEAATLLIMGVVAYCWFLYSESRLGARYSQHRRFAVVAAIPVFIVVLLYATTRFTGWIYSIGPDASFTNGPIALLPEVIFLLYVVYTAAHAFLCFLREKSSARRRECLTLVGFAIPPIVCGLVDTFMHGMPVMAISVFASLLLVFMNSQDSRINTDALTGLNNRRRASEYIEDSLAGMPEGAIFGVFMIDVDYFKDINDTRGHGEGDHALRIIAEGLRHAMDGHHGLAARWGGDEFLVATFLMPAEKPAEVERVMRERINEACEREEFGDGISVSIGAAMAEDGDKLNDLVAKADVVLYEQKAAHHAALKPTGGSRG